MVIGLAVFGLVYLFVYEVIGNVLDIAFLNTVEYCIMGERSRPNSKVLFFVSLPTALSGFYPVLMDYKTYRLVKTSIIVQNPTVQDRNRVQIQLEASSQQERVQEDNHSAPDSRKQHKMAAQLLGFNRSFSSKYCDCVLQAHSELINYPTLIRSRRSQRYIEPPI